MSRPRRNRVPRSSRRSSQPSGGSSGRADLPVIPAGELLENIVRDVQLAGKTTGFQGTVDLQIDLQGTSIDSNGFLVALISGKQTNTSTTSVKLATRIHLGDPVAEATTKD